MSRIITIIDALPIGVTSSKYHKQSGNNFANKAKLTLASMTSVMILAITAILGNENLLVLYWNFT